MVPLVRSQQQKFALRSQVPEKPPADALSPCSPCSSPSPSPCSLFSLELFVLWLVMVLYFTYNKAKPPLCSGAPHRAQQKPSIQQPSNLDAATDLAGMGEALGLSPSSQFGRLKSPICSLLVPSVA